MIQLLPESLANQIAAGEVVQRPASVVKELLENSVDAGATAIDLLIENAGKTLIQVVDNGCGMSPTDARMCFERHATSKIKTIDDLFAIHTYGFRGEAMASIAAVSQTILKTRRAEDELGLQLEVEGGVFKPQTVIPFPVGSSVAVKNLFFNVPARRNFLKSNPVETRHILLAFYHLALSRPEIKLTFSHNGELIHDLPAGNLSQRILALYPSMKSVDLLPLNEETAALKISGFIGTPEVSRKSRDDQFFMVNQRFVKNAYLHHAVQKAFADTLPPEHQPFYALFIDLPPKQVDINIHPTKTEIKFEDDRMVYSFLHSAARQAIGRLHNEPLFDFPERDAIRRNLPAKPAEEVTLKQFVQKQEFSRQAERTLPRHFNWQELYAPQDDAPEPTHKPLTRPALQPDAPVLFDEAEWPVFQLHDRYIVVQQTNGILVVDQAAAHYRIVYERFVQQSKRSSLPVQRLLFPQTLLFSSEDYLLLEEALPRLRQLGFDLSFLEQGKILLAGAPAELRGADLQPILEQILASIKETGEIHDAALEAIALMVAQRGAIQAGRKLKPAEMTRLTRDLLACDEPAYSPNGQKTYFQLGLADFERFLS